MSARTPPPTFAAGTVVTSDYLPWARVLAASFAVHHPGVPFAVVALDEPDPALVRPDDAFELLSPADVGLGADELGWMAAIYDGFELSCAVKPWLLRALLDRADAALYVDSDILVTGALDDIAARAADTGLVLSPHTLEPPPDDGLAPDEDTFLRLGQFNGGFLAVGHDGRPFLDWWASRLARECVAAGGPETPRFVDQRWLDLAVNYFPLEVLRDRGANVAYWNLGTRTLQHIVDGYRVDGVPLRFMHFSGFDPARPDVLSKHLGEPARVDTGRSPALRRICAEYADRLLDAGLRPGVRTPYAFGTLPAGITLTPVLRRTLRHALIEAERAGAPLPPNPFDAGAQAALLGWLGEPVTDGGVSRFLLALHAVHRGIAAALPHVPGADEAPYLAWARTDGVEHGLVPAALAAPFAPVVLDGARAFAVLIHADEVAADPSLLAGLDDVFAASDDVTLVLWAPGRDPQDFAAALEPVLAAAGLDGPDAPDLLGVLDDVPAPALGAAVHAVLTHRPAAAVLGHLPHADDAAAVRALADAAPTGRGAVAAAV